MLRLGTLVTAECSRVSHVANKSSSTSVCREVRDTAALSGLRRGRGEDKPYDIKKQINSRSDLRSKISDIFVSVCSKINLIYKQAKLF